MKLAKISSRKVGDKEYHKFIINLPSELVKEAKMKGGDKLTAKVERGRIIISKERKKSKV